MTNGAAPIYATTDGCRRPGLTLYGKTLTVWWSGRPFLAGDRVGRVDLPGRVRWATAYVNRRIPRRVDQSPDDCLADKPMRAKGEHRIALPCTIGSRPCEGRTGASRPRSTNAIRAARTICAFLDFEWKETGRSQTWQEVRACTEWRTCRRQPRLGRRVMERDARFEQR